MITKHESLQRYHARIAARWSDLTTAQIDELSSDDAYANCVDDFADRPEAAADDHMDSFDLVPTEGHFGPAS